MGIEAKIQVVVDCGCQVLEMIANIQGAFHEILNENDWMDEATKDFARRKVNKFESIRTGFTDCVIGW